MNVLEILNRRRDLINSNEEPDQYITQPFTIIFNTANSIYFDVSDPSEIGLTYFKYKINNNNWVTVTSTQIKDESYGDYVYPFDGSSIEFNDGDILQIMANGEWNNSTNTSGGMKINIYGNSSTDSITLEGNLLSLVYADNFINGTTLPNHAFCGGVIANIYPSSRPTVDIQNLRIPAVSVGNYCFKRFFYGFVGLINVPKKLLPATTLGTNCYQEMFYNCASITEAPDLPATTLKSSCYRQMFYGCNKITKAPDLPATTLVKNCYTQMFYRCTRLAYIKAMFTTTPSTSYTNDWVNSVSSTGTFVKNSAAQWNVTGTSGIPSGWTVQTASS